MNEYLARIKGFGVRGKAPTRSTPVRDESGKQVGEQVEHKDGRIDARVTSYDIAVNPNLSARKGDE